MFVWWLYGHPHRSDAVDQFELSMLLLPEHSRDGSGAGADQGKQSGPRRRIGFILGSEYTRDDECGTETHTGAYQRCLFDVVFKRSCARQTFVTCSRLRVIL